MTSWKYDGLTFLALSYPYHSTYLCSSLRFWNKFHNEEVHKAVLYFLSNLYALRVNWCKRYFSLDVEICLFFFFGGGGGEGDIMRERERNVSEIISKIRICLNEMWRWNINEIILRFHRVNIFKVDFVNYTPFSDNVVYSSVKLNGALKAVSEIPFISNKTMSCHSRESIKNNNEKIENLFRFLTRTVWTGQGLIFQILPDVAKYGCVRVQ